MNDVATATAPAPIPVADPHLCPACNARHAGSETAAIKQLAQTPARLKKLVKGLDAKGLATSYGPGKWNVTQVLCHLRDCELMFGMRWRLMLSEQQPTMLGFDQDHWADQTRYAKQDALRALATHELLRAGNLEMLKLAGKKGLDRAGNHADYGLITIRQMVRHIRAHDEKHLAHLEAARANWQAAKRKRARK